MREALGCEFLGVFLAIERQESDRFAALVTDADHEWHLDTI